MMPRPANNSSTMRRPSGKRKYSHTARQNVRYCDHRGSTCADWQAWWYDANYDSANYDSGVQGVSMSDDEPFALEEVKIDQLHEAIKAGRTTCVAVVQHYIGRARVFNGVRSRLVSEDGAPVPTATGAVRATATMSFTAETGMASCIVPDSDEFTGA